MEIAREKWSGHKSEEPEVESAENGEHHGTRAQHEWKRKGERGNRGKVLVRGKVKVKERVALDLSIAFHFP